MRDAILIVMAIHPYTVRLESYLIIKQEDTHVDTSINENFIKWAEKFRDQGMIFAVAGIPLREYSTNELGTRICEKVSPSPYNVAFFLRSTKVPRVFLDYPTGVQCEHSIIDVARWKHPHNRCYCEIIFYVHSTL